MDTHPMARLCTTGLSIVLSGAVSAADAQGVTAVRVASGLDRPVFVTAPPGDGDRLFIVEQHTGAIRILNLPAGTINATPFLTVPSLAVLNEQGLLGLAFHPDYFVSGSAGEGFFYVNLTAAGTGATHIRRYRVSPDHDIADASSATTILTYDQPQANHNGGWIGFGPDGYLYICSGDGGNADDGGTGHTAGTGNAQDITDNRLGKILRIDVDGDDFPADANRNYAIPADNPFVGATGDDEIWAYGLRNPWRAAFDRLTGDLYVGDVGQGAREEIDVQPASSAGGENYGWRLREGVIATPTGGVGGSKPPGAIDPIYEYAHGSGATEGRCVTGGYVYRGPIESLRGAYLFGDYVGPRIWSLRFDGSDPSSFDGTNFSDFTDWTDRLTPDTGSIDRIASFGEDAHGNLYLVDLDGEVFVLASGPVPGWSSWGLASLAASLIVVAGVLILRRRAST